MHIVPAENALRIIGIELRTSNAEAMQTIPPHWQRFHEEGVLARIAGKLSDEVYAVYTHFENAGLNNDGIYSLIIGAPVSSAEPVPPGMTHAVLPACARAVFPVPQGRFDQVGPVWQTVWERHDLPKTFIAEVERYRADGQIDICIGLRHGASA
ncbi:GyrI-like domain-containing protein [Hydrogenophaga sp. BPS33]|uniref:GyrI-like domain-containing protein n=1 Tax=Hydrogenophaga sp. BPS33 TaxID=2651974 RepID=UPI00131FC4DD|nr:effector binding domain-containing protein [Hydrogenophaga sp. BPS33]QHE86730.1 AraC family transcriptional regulator [Hydrogenophaga sp. BPS33]